MPRQRVDAHQRRALTDAAHGLRPGHLLLFMLRACAGAWNVARLVGIDARFQVKGRWNHRADERRFDDETFWTEASGTLAADGHWQLPVRVPQRPLDDVPGRRHAVYRRRYALLAEVALSAR